jgi:hypothetical protein
LQAALNSALAAAPPGREALAIAIVALNPGGDRPLAEVHGYDEYYSASLMKVCAMYAAYELREVLRGMAKELGANAKAKDFLKEVGKYLNSLIKTEYKKIPLFAHLPLTRGLPNYEKIFVAYDGAEWELPPGIVVDFLNAFVNNKKKMIEVSNNVCAGECIHALGFGYIGAVLAAGGFFDPKTNKGLWLAGDYKNGWDPVRIPADNSTHPDGAAQAATVVQLASLYTLMYDKKLVSSTASDEMLKDLKDPVIARESFINRLPHKRPPEIINFKVSQTKLGIGDPLAYLSEASILKHIAGDGAEGSLRQGPDLPEDREFVVAWQNVLSGEFPGDIYTVSRVIRDTLTGYLGPPGAPAPLPHPPDPPR